MTGDYNTTLQKGPEVSAAAKGRGAPAWAVEPIEALIDHLVRLQQLLHLSTKGISVLRGVPQVVKVLADVRGKADEPETQEKIKRATEEAELALREVNEGFPILHAHYIVALWATLEATVRLLVARWLQNHKPAMEAGAVQRMRVRLGEYEPLEGEDRYFYILDRLEQEASAPLRCGVTRFESILDPFGLSGPVDEDVRRDIFELNQVRNAVVHRAGKADRRLVEACPWLSFKTGDAVIVEHDAAERYFVSVFRYATELTVRVGEKFGVDMQEFRSKREEH